MIDCNFPIITYDKDKTPQEWGQAHGEEFSRAIKELFEIRKGLMLEKNPALKRELKPLALEQWEATKKWAPYLSPELLGIAEGSGLELEDIVLLNNYTDFRDIALPDEGCSTIHVQSDKGHSSGQTWDMHGSAKNYLSLIKVPSTKDTPESVVFSLVGCVGMMGVNFDH